MESSDRATSTPEHMLDVKVHGVVKKNITYQQFRRADQGFQAHQAFVMEGHVDM